MVFVYTQNYLHKSNIFCNFAAEFEIVAMNPLFRLSEDYSDIIHLTPPTIVGHPRMDLLRRAAQFAPFAAVSDPDQEEKEASVDE